MNSKRIEGFENYIVCDDGRIVNLDTNKELKGSIKRTGYVEVALYDKDGSHGILLHRLVAKAFVDGYAEGKEVNHKDGDKTNNSADNLEWVWHADNLKHAYETGLRADDVSPRAVRGVNIETGEAVTFASIYKAARFLGISQGNICMCCKGARPNAGGYIWEYIPEE